MPTQPDAKIVEFNELIEKLWSLTDSYLLRQEIDATPRRTRDLADQIARQLSPKFEIGDAIALIDVIESRGTVDDIDPKIKSMIEIVDLARKVYWLYAEIHGLEVHETRPTRRSPATAWVDWSQADEIDTITAS